MNNLFRITKDNVNNLLTEYNKNKQNNKNIDKTHLSKKLKKSKTLHSQKKINSTDLMEPIDLINSIDKYIHTPKILQTKTQTKTQTNFNCEKNKTFQSNNLVGKNFNCDNNKITIKPVQNDINKINNILISNLSGKTNQDVDLELNLVQDHEQNTNKLIIKYGKSSIKLDKLKKSMGNNLKLLKQLDNMVKFFLDFYPKLKLSSLIKNNDNNNLNTNKKIYTNDNGYIIIESNKYFNIVLNKKNTLDEKKFNLIDFGYIKLYDVKFTDEFIFKHKIPSIDSIITYSDNIKHFLKLIKLFEYTNKYKIKINQFDKNNFLDIIFQNLPIILTNINEKVNLFNSIDKKFTFYLKITLLKTIAFIIDKKEKLLYYINTIENNSSGYVFFYILKIDSKYKIIDLNKINNTDKTYKINKTDKTDKTDKIKIIKKNNNNNGDNNDIKKNKIIKEKSSSISDFTDSEKFCSFIPIKF
jgi:hypothetical protein